MEAGFGQAIARIPAMAHAPASSSGGPIRIGASHDPAEFEADSLASRVLGSRRSAPRDRNGVDFSKVQIHDGADAAASARDVGAAAYTVGNQIVFGGGRYAPGSGEGRRLLAHELAHVLQGQRAPALSLRRQEGPGSSAPAQITGVTMSVSLDGLTFDVPEQQRYSAGRRTPQLLAIVLKRLVGGGYPAKLEGEVEKALVKGRQERQGGFEDKTPAKAGEEIGTIHLSLQSTIIVLDLLAAKKIPTVLTDSQKQLLRLGLGSQVLWHEFKQTLRRDGIELPRWYDMDLFQSELASQAKLLRGFTEAWIESRSGDEEATLRKKGTLADVISELIWPIFVAEAVRSDFKLANDPTTALGYAAIWAIPKSQQKKELTQAPSRIQSKAMLAMFLSYQRTQRQLAVNAEVDAEDRRELMRRFSGFAQRTTFSGAEGDQQLRDQPATANAPAFPSSLTPVPAVMPPLYDAAMGTDHRFAMEVQYPSVYEALGNYAFNWERVRVPDDKIGAPVDVTQLKGEKISAVDVAAVRFSRTVAYAKADIQRTIENTRSDIGAPGVGALELVGANAILRFLGTGIKLFLDYLTMPRDQKLVTFPSPGLYMVRASVSQVRTGNEAVVRAPSVAYYPVLAREPDEMAREGLKAELTGQEKTRERIKELEAKLAGPLSDEDRKSTLSELEALKSSQAPLSDRLAAKLLEAQKLEKDLKADPSKGDVETATKQREQIEKVIALRGKRDLAGGQAISARFVSDLGQQLSLLLEVADRPAPKGKSRVYLSDVTTPKSGDATGSGNTRDEAIANALRQLLESIHGYGRGRVALSLASGVKTIRIEAGQGALLMEAVENVTTALSVAAIVAAPLTGGATLVFLVPLGLVGAVPSAYRVAKRLEAGTFEFDLENAMELVNVAGSLIGLGRLAAGSLKAVRLGRALLVVGFGADAAGGIMMGANLISQIDALSKLPPGERASALALLLGQTLMSAGVMAGGALAERAQHRHTEAKIAAGGKEAAAEAPKGGSKDLHPTPTAEPMFKKAQTDTEMNRLGPMDKDSEARLRQDDALRKALDENPLAAAALKKCASPCFPPEMTPVQVKRLGELLTKLADTGSYDQKALKEYLYKRRNELNMAIDYLEYSGNAGDLNKRIQIYNEGKVIKLPGHAEKELTKAKVQRSHDVGVEKGKEAAKGAGLKDSGLANPLEKVGGFGQGFDDLMYTGGNLDTGDIYIVEYKGGDSKLSSGPPPQMSLDWVMKGIQDLFYKGGPKGEATARVLAKALREGRLKGVVFYTGLDGNAPRPTTRRDFPTYNAGGKPIGFK